MRTFIGIEIGGTKLQLVVGDEQAQIMERVRQVVDLTQGARGIQKQISKALQSIKLHTVGAIGIGFGGPVDYATGRILTSYQVSGWGDFVIQEWLEKLTGIPVWIDNDANIAALGEALHGAGKDCQRVFYVTLGSGVGGGLVVEHEIYHGARNTEAEFGHIRLDKSGRTVESSCSGWAVDGKVRNHVRLHPDSLLGQLARGYTRGEARVLVEALQKDDRAAQDILEQTADDLAFGLSHVVHLVNPEILILGGGLSLIGEPIRQRVEQKLSGYLMDVLQPGPPVQLSLLKEDAVPVGALTLAIHKLLSS